MIGLNTMMQRSREAMPTRSAWIEALGFIIFGLGLYLGISLYTYQVTDVTQSGPNAFGIANVGGPYGAIIAHELLSRFGITGVVWPIGLLLWGGLTALGFMMFPKARRFIAFMVLMTLFAAYAEVQFPRWDWARPSFGFGGSIGRAIAVPMLAKMGYGGAVIFLAVAAVVALVLTGNLALSRTSIAMEYAAYYARRSARRLWKQTVSTSSQRVVVAQKTSSSKEAAHGHGKVSHGDAQKVMVQGTNEKASSGSSNPTSKASLKDRLEAQKDQDQKDHAQADTSADSVEEAYGLEIHYRGPSHTRPTSKLFTRSEAAPDRKEGFQTAGEFLTKQLAEFKVFGKVTSVVEGPVVTTYEFEPAPGTKVSKISALGEDLARLLQATSLRVLAPIPGKNTVGFEIPNAERRVIGFADLIEAESFQSPKHQLPIAMGVDIFGKAITQDLAEMPHLLVAGSTGSGKSVFMNTLIASLIARHNAKDLRLIMVDPKMVEMAAYNGLPHMACPVVTDAATEAKQKLDGLVVEMEDRYQRMKAVGAKNIQGFNDVVKHRRKSEFTHYEGRWQPMPYIVLIVDELADMMMVLGKEAEVPITRLAQKARAAGIHLVIATQRPSADVVTGLIKANFPTRVAFRVLSGIDSRTILDQSGAEQLLGKGDMLFLSSGGTKRLHGAYLSEKEVAAMVKTSRQKN